MSHAVASPVISLPGALILAIALGFLVYVFTGSRRLVAGVLFVGLLALVAAGFLKGVVREAGHQGRLVELAPQRQPVDSKQLGPAAATTLFDVPAQGHSFVYVIDGSASMGQGEASSPLEALKDPLKRSVTDLQRNHRFQMFFFDIGTQTCLPAEGNREELVAADNHHVVQALACIDAWNAATGSENPERFLASDALFQALALQPDIVYFVTDGEGVRPSPKDLDSMRRWNTGRTTVHVIQVTAEGKAEKPPRWLSDLASQHRGKFQRVSIAARPAEKEPAAELPPPGKVANSGASRSAAKNGPLDKRPDWVDAPPRLGRTGPNGQQTVVKSGFSKNEERCRENFDKALLAATAKYVDQVVDRGAGARLLESDRARERTLQFIATNVVKESYREEKRDPDPAIGEGVEQYALLNFDDRSADHFRQEWRLLLQERRLFIFAAGIGLLLAFVGTIFGYLKTDTATRGYYSGRLKFVAGLAMFAIAGGAAALVMTTIG